jgi:hypothetical protein
VIARLELLRADLLDAQGAWDAAEALRSSARARLEQIDARADHPLLLRAAAAPMR